MTRHRVKYLKYMKIDRPTFTREYIDSVANYFENRGMPYDARRLMNVNNAFFREEDIDGVYIEFREIDDSIPESERKVKSIISEILNEIERCMIRLYDI